MLINNTFHFGNFVPMQEQKIITVEMVKEKTIERFWSKIKFGEVDECWEWQAAGQRYGVFSIGKAYEGDESAHRYMFMKVFDDFNKGLFVLHTCDNTKCCNPNHLYEGTPLQNMQDRDSRGRHISHKGSANANAKLKEEDILIIKEKVASGLTHQQVANLFGVSRRIIGKINEGKAWRHTITESCT